MNPIDRRSFIKLSTAAWLLAPRGVDSAPVGQPVIAIDGKKVRAAGDHYQWEWSSEDDIFRLSDREGRLITTGPVQPQILAKHAGDAAGRAGAGRLVGKTIEGNRLSLVYGDVNGGAKTDVAWRFGPDGVWFDPVGYETAAVHDVISVHYFSAEGENPSPSLQQTYLIMPGVSESSAISPILPQDLGVDWTLWLGHADNEGDASQQWGLPSHYFCGTTSDPAYNARGTLKEHLSDAFCCGLAALPAGDLFLHIRRGACAPVLVVRSDLWGQARGPGRFALGAPFFWAVGRNYHEAIRHYYRGLLRAGAVKAKVNSPAKNAIVTAPGFDTWGEEVAARKSWADFDEELLNGTYQGLKDSGMRRGIFMIDAKWEGRYGSLEPSPNRFPHFDRFIAQLRADGFKLGIWAAFLRCDDPKALGLEMRHMLRAADGKPLVKRNDAVPYYLLDFTQPDVQRVLAGIARKFIRRYRPDLVKFDFGYELPALSAGAPEDMAWAGERLLQKGLEIVVSAMREVNPDLVIMYYSLSPLLLEYLDLHSPDDLFMCGEDYAAEANRRFFFSGLLGELGMPTYGSGGYDWLSLREIWFDSAPIGSLGSLSSFSGDEQDSHPAPEIVAKYNGLSHLTRPTNIFSIEPLDPVLIGSTSGAHSSSWVRHENGVPMLVALRSRRFDGSAGPGAYRDLVQSTGSVVLASKTGDGIAVSAKLGVVPYGVGELTIRHTGPATRATLTYHCFKSAVRPRHQVQLENQHIRLTLSERLPDGSVVEWIEIDLG